jgi:hypothetical protein
VKRSIPTITAVIVVLAVASCGTDPHPKEPTGHAIPTPSPPAAASQDTAEGRAAFAAHFINLVNYTAMTGNTKPLLAISDGCTDCEKLAGNSKMVRVNGKRVETSIWRVDSIEPYGPDLEYLRIRLGENPELDVKPRTWGLWVTTDPPYKIKEMWRVEK